MLSQKQRTQLEKLRDDVHSLPISGGPMATCKYQVLRGLELALAEPERMIAGEAYRKAARAQHHVDGYLEVDDDAVVSESEEGAYVQAWVWVSKEAI